MVPPVKQDPPLVVPCKVCGQPARLLGPIDFNRNCHRDGGGLGPMGVAVYYHRCTACGLIFTIAMDDFTPADFATHIYNADYVKVDPDYTGERATQQAKMLVASYPRAMSARILDYGGGTGLLAGKLRALGFADVHTFDPFVPQFAHRPEGKFDLIVSFEVAEHSPTPRETFADIVSFAHDRSLILFSTLLQPPEIAQVGLSWWYIGPRNGHVTIYTAQALQLIARSHGMQFGTNRTNTHIFFKTLPEFANKR